MILMPSSSSLPNSSQYSMWLNKVSRVWAVPGRVVMLCGAHAALSPFPLGTALCFSCFLLNYDFFSSLNPFIMILLCCVPAYLFNAHAFIFTISSFSRSSPHAGLVFIRRTLPWLLMHPTLDSLSLNSL